MAAAASQEECLTPWHRKTCSGPPRLISGDDVSSWSPNRTGARTVRVDPHSLYPEPTLTPSSSRSDDHVAAHFIALDSVLSHAAFLVFSSYQSDCIHHEIMPATCGVIWRATSKLSLSPWLSAHEKVTLTPSSSLTSSSVASFVSTGFSNSFL